MWVSEIDFQTGRHSCIIKAVTIQAVHTFTNYQHYRSKNHFSWETPPDSHKRFIFGWENPERQIGTLGKNLTHLSQLMISLTLLLDKQRPYSYGSGNFLETQEKTYLQLVFNNVSWKMPMQNENAFSVLFAMSTSVCLLSLWLDKWLFCHIKIYTWHFSNIVDI